MALAAAVVGSDHFVGVVSVPVSLMNCSSGRSVSYTHLDVYKRQERGKYHRKYTAVARKMQESIQVYIIEYTHDETDYSVGKQLPGQCNINGVVTHS